LDAHEPPTVSQKQAVHDQIHARRHPAAPAGPLDPSVPPSLRPSVPQSLSPSAPRSPGPHPPATRSDPITQFRDPRPDTRDPIPALRNLLPPSSVSTRRHTIFPAPGRAHTRPESICNTAFHPPPAGAFSWILCLFEPPFLPATPLSRAAVEP